MIKCKQCGVDVAKKLGRGRQPLYCGEVCRKAGWKALLDAKPRSTCSVPGCDTPARRAGSGMCEKHYYRMRRQGTTEYVGKAIAGDIAHSQGYVMVAAKGHPRANGGYRAYAHRVAFTKANGEGPFVCHWCPKEVTWADMHVDHLDDDKRNNDPSNLVASCPTCNQQRGHHKQVATNRAKSGIEFNGEKLTPNEWAARIGISRPTLLFRLKSGWPLDRALTEGRGATGPKPKNKD